MAKQDSSPQLTKRGIYLLPNLLTSVGLFAGFYAIVAAMKGHFTTAAIAILIAMIADALDGRVARLMNVNTAFGTQFDSLSDLVSFGLAPSLVVYSWALLSLGKLGWLAAFLYTASVAIRLARFNVQTQSTEIGYFKGLPCPPAAGLLAAYVWLFTDYGISIGRGFSILTLLLVIILACLMISNVRYRSFKEIDFRGRMPSVSLIIIILVLVGVALYPPLVLFVVGIIYVVTAPFLTVWRYHRLKYRRHKSFKNGKNTQHPPVNHE